MISYRASTTNPAQSFAWPRDWQGRPAYLQLYHTLLTTAPERVAAIISGTDQTTNTDLAKWRGIGG